MSIFAKLASQVTVKEFINQELNDGTGSFPVVVVQGPVIGRANDGSVRITKRDNVRVPLFGYTMEEVQDLFPAVGDKIAGVKIQQELLQEPRQWDNPETGERITVLYRYEMVPADGSLSQAPVTQAPAGEAPKPDQAPKPQAQKIPDEVGTDAPKA